MEVCGTTSTGFKYKYDDRILNDYKLLEAVSIFDNAKSTVEQIGALKDLLDFMLGPEKDKLLAHVAKKNDGYRPIPKIQSELLEMISASNDLKNSSSSHGSKTSARKS